MKTKDYTQFHCKQNSITECGVCCLQSIFRFFGHNIDKEILKKISGTSSAGTTLLGLYKASNKMGLHADGYEGGIEELKKLQFPSILHVIIEGKILHYVVCYGFNGTNFVIGDPRNDIVEMSPEKLDSIWQSKRLLCYNGVFDFKKFETNGGKSKSSQVGILSLLDADIGVLIMASAIGLLIALLGLSLAYFSQILLDDLLKGSAISNRLITALCILFISYLVKNILTYLRNLLFLKQSEALSRRMTKYFYNKLLRLGMLYLNRMRTGDLITRLNDIVRIQSTVNYIFGSLVIDILILILVLLFIFALIPTLGLIILGFASIFLMISYLETKKMMNAQKIVIESYGSLESTYLSILQSIDAIKVYNKEDLFSKLTLVIHSIFEDNIYQFGRYKNKLNLIYSIFGSLIVMITIVFAIRFYYAGGLQIGNIVALIQVSLMVISPLINLSLSNFKIQEANIAFQRLNEFVISEPEYQKKTDLEKIKFEDFSSMSLNSLSFKFAGTVKLIENINLEIRRGDLILIKGNSGVGKSTLLKIFQKLYEIPNGLISVNNIEWNNLSTYYWRELIGVVDQEIKIFNGSIAFNISLDESVNQDKIETFCISIGLHNYFLKFFDGYKTIVGETGISLSGGQRQLVGLARAVYKSPQILFLDEATSFLDEDTQLFIFSLLKEFCKQQKLTIIYISHDPNLTVYADKTLYI